jgi:hypothetical protein
MKLAPLVFLALATLAYADGPPNAHSVGGGLYECNKGFVMLYDGGRPQCAPEAMTRGPRFEVSTVPSAGDGAKTDCPSGGCDAAIESSCAREWPSDYSMQLYCVKKQRDARDKIEGRSDSIAEHCAKEWPSDYTMQAYCQNKQTSALRELQR